MFACECLVAAALLTTSPDATLPSDAEAWAEVCRTELLALALDAQLLDRLEQNQFLVYAHDYQSDVRRLQGRFADYAFAPVIEECARFPDRATIDGFLSFNRAYREELLTRLGVDTVNADELRRALAETDDLHRTWNVLRDARCYYYITVRRQALDRLRTLLGDHAFYTGCMPPYVPVWRFPLAGA